MVMQPIADRTPRKFYLDPNSQEITNRRGGFIKGFTDGVWSDEQGRAQLRIIKENGAWVVQRRCHTEATNIHHGVSAKADRWIRDSGYQVILNRAKNSEAHHQQAMETNNLQKDSTLM